MRSHRARRALCLASPQSTSSTPVLAAAATAAFASAQEIDAYFDIGSLAWQQPLMTTT